MPELRYGSPNEAGMLPERIDRVRDLAAGWVKEGYTPALSVLAGATAPSQPFTPRTR